MKARTMIGAVAALLLIAVPITAQVAHAQSADTNANVPKCVPSIPSAGDVLVTAGEDANDDPTSVTTEFFHPATGAWQIGCPSKSQHDEGGLLPYKGGLLEMGGELARRDRAHNHIMNRSAERYDPATGKFKPGPALRMPLEDFPAVVLGDGTLVIAGGVTNNDKELAVRTIETLNRDTWKTLKAKLSVARAGACAAVMTTGAQSGQVLIAGGTSAPEEDSPQLPSADLYNPATGKVIPTTNAMNVARGFPVCTALNDGTVLVTGGYDDNFDARATAEIYDPATGSFTLTSNDMSSPRVGHIAVLLNDGKVLVAGGDTGSSVVDTADLYDPATGKFTALPAMNDFHDWGAATLITSAPLSGQVLIVGGFFGVTTENTAELYDPVHQTFTSTAPMNFAHGEPNVAVIP